MNGARMADTSGGPAETPAVCFVLDDEPAVGRFIAMALHSYGRAVEQFIDLHSMLIRLEDGHPDLIFLDVALGDHDAIDAIHALTAVEYGGAIALMSGDAAAVLEDVRLIGQRQGLNMLAPLTKPFRLDMVKSALDAALHEQPATMIVADRAIAPVVPLRQALDEGWIEFWYQPKIDIRKRELVGAEALARVRHPELGILRPDSFLPQASEADLIGLADLGLHRVLSDSSTFAQMGRAMKLALNIPVDALVSLPVASMLKDHRRRTGEPCQLMLEVTEDQVARDVALAYEVATKLRIQGVEFALDDFGKGYSSLSRIGELPFSELKIDLSFVSNCARDVEKAHLCRMVIDLAHRLGWVAVAEGIERLAELAVIRDLGCDIVQGYLFAHPMPKEFLQTRLVGQSVDGGFGHVIDMLEPPHDRAIA